MGVAAEEEGPWGEEEGPGGEEEEVSLQVSSSVSSSRPAVEVDRMAITPRAARTTCGKQVNKQINKQTNKQVNMV